MQNSSEFETENEPRKPRLALMGEFSAGKSTLSNLLLGADPLPVRVTATRLPPIWMSYGDQPGIREDLDGNPHPIDMSRLDAVSLDETRLIRLYLKADLLQLCDLIDMPGISDPNMSCEVWQNVIGDADSVIWCTHATQAWRQSEAAVWEAISPNLNANNLLLLTRFDKILSERDRNRVLSRVRRETSGLFSDFFPVSLTRAMEAGDDREKWQQSGAQAFVERLVEMLVDPAAPAHGTYDTAQGGAHPGPAPETTVQTTDPEAGESQARRVIPSRVTAKTGKHKKIKRPGGNSSGSRTRDAFFMEPAFDA